MTIPVWALLGFAVWTLVTLITTVGVYRWTRILSGRAPISSFRSDKIEGKDWYRRAMRAHANCVENLAVYAAIVIVIVASGTTGRLLDTLAIMLLVARVCQTLVHVSLAETDTTVSVRFSFFFIQFVCMIWMSVLVVRAVV